MCAAEVVGISRSKAGLMLAGQQLRVLRERLGFTLKDVEVASLSLVQRYQNPKYWIAQSRLSNIESKGFVPNIFCLQALALIYRCSLLELLAWYGIEPGADPVGAPPKTHIARELPPAACEKLVILDPLFDPKRTTRLRWMIQGWGLHPVANLSPLKGQEFAFGYVGSEDYTLYPLLLPGSFLEIDTAITQIEPGPWESELERPIYFCETHEEYVCGWCAMLNSTELQLQPHHLSGLATRVYQFPAEIEVVGQVVGIATELPSATYKGATDLAGS
jgi:hypothetical protein